MAADKTSSDAVEALGDLEKKIIRQVEYYFGNYNLGRDKFLKEEIKLDDGWVKLETLVKFNRLKSLSEDFSVITEALKSSQLMEVNEDWTKIRRRTEKPLPDLNDSTKNEFEERTLYVKGFKTQTTLDELLDFFKDYKAEHITMRRIYKNPNKPFKGSVFVTFETKENAEEFFALKEIKFHTIPLLREKKKDFIQRKDELYQKIKTEKAMKKEKKEVEVKQETEVEAPDFVKGCLLSLLGLGKKTTREDIKEVLGPYGTVGFVDYSKGNPTAVVRFESGVVPSLLEKIPEEDGVKKIDICSEKVTAIGLENDKEVQYWKDVAVGRKLVRKKKGAGSYKHSGKKGRFSQKQRKRKFSIDDEATLSKQVKREELKSEDNDNNSVADEEQ